MPEKMRQVSRQPARLSDLPETNPLALLPLPDLHVPMKPRAQERLLSHREYLDAHHMALVLGDAVAFYGTPHEYEALDEFLDELALPYVVTTGNHEFTFEIHPEGSEGHGEVFKLADLETRRMQRRRFRWFFGLRARFQCYHHRLASLFVLGLDDVRAHATPIIRASKWDWFASHLERVAERLVVVFAHVPVSCAQACEFRYYTPGLMPFLRPPERVLAALRGRRQPVVWVSGHLHVAPGHPLYRPYEALPGVWQVHCPDGTGLSRRDASQWHPRFTRRILTRDVLLSSGEVRTRTFDHTDGDFLPETDELLLHFPAG